MAILDIFLAQARQRSIEKLAEDYSTDKVAVPEMTTLEKIVSNPTVSDVIDYLDPEDNIAMKTLQGVGEDIVGATDINTQKSNLKSTATSNNWNDEKFQRRRLLTKRQNNELSKGPELTWLERFSNSDPVSKFLDFYEGSLPDQMINSALSGEIDREMFGNIGKKLFDATEYLDPGVRAAQRALDDNYSVKSDLDFARVRNARQKAKKDAQIKALLAKQGIKSPEDAGKRLSQILPAPKHLAKAMQFTNGLSDTLTGSLRKKAIRRAMRRKKIEAMMENVANDQSSWGKFRRLIGYPIPEKKPDYADIITPGYNTWGGRFKDWGRELANAAGYPIPETPSELFNAPATSVVSESVRAPYSELWKKMYGYKPGESKGVGFSDYADAFGDETGLNDFFAVLNGDI